MACFLVPTAEAIVVTAANKLAAKKETAEVNAISAEKTEVPASSKISFHEKLKWLRNMLWGGAILLAFEHIWHGEVVPWFPFLTAAESPAAFAEMLGEMATTGVMMAVLVTVVWGFMLLGAHAIERRKGSPQSPVKQGVVQ